MINIREFLGLNYYTSELDDFLAELAKSYPKLSPSQRKEIEKYKRIYALRDQPSPVEQTDTLWDKF